jgi:hypothetical protein
VFNSGDAHVAVEIWVAAILARSEDRAAIGGGSRHEKE